MNFTQDDLIALKAALLMPEAEVTIGDRRVKFKTQKEILQMIQIVQEALDGVPTESPNQIAASFSKGQK